MNVDAREMSVRAAVQRAAELAGDVEVTLHVAAQAESVRADPSHLQRILVSLLANALHHGAPPISVTAIVDGDLIALRVYDCGPGVSPALEGRLFEPPLPILSTSPGAGVSLAISRELARANGGDLAYRRRDGGGACFTLTLPALDSLCP